MGNSTKYGTPQWLGIVALAAALTGCATVTVEPRPASPETISDYESPPWNTPEMINMDTEIVHLVPSSSDAAVQPV